MPFSRRVSPDPNPRDDLLIVHANPYDVDRIIFPPEEMQETLYGKVRQSDDELDGLIGNNLVGVLAFGHLHIPSIRRRGDVMLVNVSSVSLPGDGDPSAKYALLTWDDEAGWTVEHRRIAYPAEPEIAAFEANRPPGWEGAVESLRQEGMIPQRV
jgi:hypothetical protein